MPIFLAVKPQNFQQTFPSTISTYSTILNINKLVILKCYHNLPHFSTKFERPGKSQLIFYNFFLTSTKGPWALFDTYLDRDVSFECFDSFLLKFLLSFSLSFFDSLNEELLILELFSFWWGTLFLEFVFFELFFLFSELFLELFHLGILWNYLFHWLTMI